MAVMEQQDTPLMQQWRAAKASSQGAIVFARVGDFYEKFYRPWMT
jgi:DNA mismatch repair ATPase MutS